MSNPNGQPKKAKCIRGHDTTKPEARGHAGVCLACQSEKMRERRASEKRTNTIIAQYDPKLKPAISSVAEADAREERREARLEAREARRRAQEGLSDAR